MTYPDVPVSPPVRPGRFVRAISWVLGILVLLMVSLYVTREFWLKSIRAYVIGSSYVAAEDYGRNLPEVDEIEILALEEGAGAGDPDSFAGDLGFRGRSVNRRTIKGDEASKVADIWRHIPFDRRFGGLCHHPYYALRFRHQGKLVYETSVCWSCASYRLPVLFDTTFYGFDEKSEEAQALLAVLSSYAPHPVKKDG